MKRLLGILLYVIGLPFLGVLLWFLVPPEQYLRTVVAAFFTYIVSIYLIDDLLFRHKNHRIS